MRQRSRSSSNQAGLFGDPGEASASRSRAPKTPKDATPKADVQQVFDAYHAAFLARHGVKPMISGGKDGKLVKQMVATWGLPAVLDLVGRFVASNDSWATRRGWTLGAMFDLAPRLMVGGAAVDARTADNLDAATRAMQPRG